MFQFNNVEVLMCYRTAQCWSIAVFTESAPRPIQSESQHVQVSRCVSVCPLQVKFNSRPLIGPQVT